MRLSKSWISCNTSINSYNNPDLIYQNYTPFFIFHAIHRIPIFHPKFQQISYNKEIVPATISKFQPYVKVFSSRFLQPSHFSSVLFLVPSVVFLMIRKERTNKYTWKTGSLLFFRVQSIVGSMYLREKPIAKPV